MSSKEKRAGGSTLLRTSVSSLNDGDRSLAGSVSSNSVAASPGHSRPSRIRIVTTKPPWSRREGSISSDDETAPGPGRIPRRSNNGDRLGDPSNSLGPLANRISNFLEPGLNPWPFSGKGKSPESNRKNVASTSIQWSHPRHFEDGDAFRYQQERYLQNELPIFELPIPPTPAPYTVAQVQTPGWDTPWSPTGPKYNGILNTASGHLHKEASINTIHETSSNRPGTSLSRKSRKKAFRKFILNNTYVPLLFRVINLAFTTAALAVAVRIRRIEISHKVTGAIGSSPNLVIIFAPLTIVHVIWAIYLEYWGRPLGLWRTSAKLGYTLSETLFICAWSAALSLCFDNIFTSPLQCTPISATKWYSSLPPPLNPLTQTVGRSEDGPTDLICESQNALIALVTVGLLSYCANLVISLFRIFEKVKYHSHSLREP